MIKLTNIAKEKMISLIKKHNGTGLYLYVTCCNSNRFKYEFNIMNIDKKINRTDKMIEIDKYKLYICNKSIMFLTGTSIDYKDDIMGSRFDFKNSYILNKCSCGQHFDFK